MKVGDLVRLRANKKLYGFVYHITYDNKFYYVKWFNDKNSAFPYAFTSLELVF
jgi:hypothetical protein